MLAVNVEGTKNVLRASFEAGVDRVVYTSTVGCLGLNSDAHLNETPVCLDDLT
jgi:dihydroflavonol-4-reductase